MPRKPGPRQDSSKPTNTPARPTKSAKRAKAQTGETTDIYVRATVSYTVPVPETGLDSPPLEMPSAQFVGRYLHKAGADKAGLERECKDEYHVYTDVYLSDLARSEQAVSLFHYSADPAVRYRVDRAFEMIAQERSKPEYREKLVVERMTPELLDRYVEETRDTGAREFFETLKKKHSGHHDDL